MKTYELLREEIDKKGLKVNRISNQVGFDVAKVIYGKRKITVDEFRDVCKVSGINPTIFFQENA